MAETAGDRRFDVVISGASYAGIALARALRVALGDGFRIALIDRSAEPPSRPDARAFAVSAGTRQMLDVLGIWQQVAPYAEPVTSIEITDSSLDDAVRPAVLTYSNTLADGEPASSIIPALPLMQALYEKARSDAGIRLLAPAEAEHFDPGPYRGTVSLADGRQLEATLVVPAEGRRSRLRDAAGIKSVGWGYDQTGIVTTIGHEKPHGGRAIQHFLPSGPFAVLPLPGNRSCVTWSANAREAESVLALDDAGFLDQIERRLGGRLGQLTLAGPRQSWPLEMHLARRYVAPRLALIGDTAHGVHPLAGQGLNLAMRDAAALAEVVADAVRLGLDFGSTAILERYERWRRFDSALSSAVFDGLNRLFSNDSTAVRALRDVGLGLVNGAPEVKALLVEEAAGLTGEVPRLLRGLEL